MTDYFLETKLNTFNLINTSSIMLLLNVVYTLYIIYGDHYSNYYHHYYKDNSIFKVCVKILLPNTIINDIIQFTY